jgi:hypothetical protein
LCTLALVSLALIACGERGHVRVSNAELVGTYVTEFASGKEQLVLRSDNTYKQVFSSDKRNFTNQGKWQSEYVLLEGTDVELTGANCSEDDPVVTGTCIRNLNVHRERGRLKLALNEAADWYYDRVD